MTASYFCAHGQKSEPCNQCILGMKSTYEQLEEENATLQTMNTDIIARMHIMTEQHQTQRDEMIERIGEYQEMIRDFGDVDELYESAQYLIDELEAAERLHGFKFAGHLKVAVERLKNRIEGMI